MVLWPLHLHLQVGEKTVQCHFFFDQLKEEAAGRHHILQDRQGELLDRRIHCIHVDVTHYLRDTKPSINGRLSLGHKDNKESHRHKLWTL